MDLRPNEQRGKLAIVMIWISLACHIICILSDIFEYRLLDAIKTGGEYSMEEVNASDSRQILIAAVTTITLFVSGIIYIRWFRRAYFNLHTITRGNLNSGEGWAAGSWFIPLVNLVWPYQIMAEMYKRTTEFLNEKGVTTGLNMNTVNIWWTLWVIVMIFSRVAFKYALMAEDIDQLMLSNMLDAVESALYIPLSFLAVAVVRNYMAAEKLLEEMDDEPAADENVQPIPVTE